MKTFLISAAIIFGSALVPAIAQQRQLGTRAGLVEVDLSIVKAVMGRAMKVGESEVPTSVQVPVGVAAPACGITATVLAQQNRTGTAQCQAKKTTQALNLMAKK